MKTARIIVILLAAIAVSIAFSVSYAADRKGFSVQARGENRLALVIGNGSYKDIPLSTTVNDADEMEKTLTYLGFSVKKETDISHPAMEKAIRDFGSSLRPGDTALFYFSGHGVQSDGNNYLIPIGADIQGEDEIKHKCVPADMVLAKMKQAGSGVNIVILDACRNNPFKGFKSMNQGLASMDATVVRGTFIAYATAPKTVAYTGTGSTSIYTKHLIKLMKTPGLKIEDIFKRIRESVMAETSDKQMPWESSSLIGKDFYFADSGSITIVTPPTPTPEPAPKQATLNITADVSGAEVWVNGNKQGVLPRNFTISESGKYEVEVTASGYKKYRTSKKQMYCWTSDKRSSGGAWFVLLNYRGVGWDDGYGTDVRAVRSRQ